MELELIQKTRLIDLAQVIRSKNAGPLHVTLDIMFPDMAAFTKAASSSALTAEAVAGYYGVEPDDVAVIPFPAAHAIKIVLHRPIVAGSPGDCDVYGAQQHRPLLEVVL